MSGFIFFACEHVTAGPLLCRDTSLLLVAFMTSATDDWTPVSRLHTCLSVLHGAINDYPVSPASQRQSLAREASGNVFNKREVGEHVRTSLLHRRCRPAICNSRRHCFS